MNWLRRLFHRGRAMKDGLLEAERRLDEAREQDSEVRRMAEQLRKIRERNNFAASFAAALRGHR